MREANNMAAKHDILTEIKGIANSALAAFSLGNYPASCLWDIIRKCDAALAAPIRNCDRYKTRTDAVKAYLHEAANGTCETNQFVDWLFATVEKGVENA